MNIDSKRAVALIGYLPFALPLGAGTFFLAGKLGMYFEWGQFSIPGTADYNSVMQALLYQFFAFLALLSIPRSVLYMKGKTKKRWTFLLYWVVPVVSAFFLPDDVFGYVLMVIAAVAWLEVCITLDPARITLPNPSR